MAAERHLIERIARTTHLSAAIVRANLEEWADAVANGAEYRFKDDQRIGNVAVLEAIAKSAESRTWETV